jgi:prevent-host-death family protein
MTSHSDQLYGILDLTMGTLKQISVSALKAKLLEVVRHVERGESFEITKDGRKVGLLCPTERQTASACGFAQVEILGDIVAPIGGQAWGADEENLAPSGTARSNRGKKA